MNNEIKKSYNYSALPVDVLTNLLKHLKLASIDKKKEVLKALIKKYFMDKTSFNLYKLLTIERVNFLSRTEQLSLRIEILYMEFSTSNKEIPKEFLTSFFDFFTKTIDLIESEIKANNGTIEWNLLDIPKLIDYLSDTKNLNISSPSLRQKINDLILKIKEEWNNKLEKDKKSQELIETETNSKIKNLETLKLQKSKLNKNTFVDALSSFKLYEDKDKEYLINFMIKHSWTSMTQYINAIDIFDYFKDKCHENPAFSKWNLLYNGLTKSLYKKQAENFDAWKNYFEVKTVDELITVLKDMYLSYDGSTELGFNLYIKDIFRTMLGRDIIFESSYEIIDSLRYLELENMYHDFEQFTEFKNKSLYDFCKAKSFDMGYSLSALPVIDKNTGKMIEFIQKPNIYQSPVNYYWTIYKKYNQLLFDYLGQTTRQTNITYFIDDKLFKDSVNEFVYLPDSIYFDGDMLTKIRNDKLLVPYNDGMRHFIRRYFAQNDDLISDDIIKSFWFNDENRKIFFDHVSYITYSGIYQKPEEYAEYFFARLYDSLDFSKIEDIKLYLALNINYPSNSTIKKFYDKLKSECPDFYEMIDDFLSGELKDSYSGIKTSLSIFYNFN